MQQSIDSQPIALTVRVSADRQQQQKKYIPIGLKKPNIYKLPSSCNLLPVCCCCYLLPRRRAGWITGAVVKKKRRFIMDSRCAGFFLFKKSAQLGRGISLRPRTSWSSTKWRIKDPTVAERGDHPSNVILFLLFYPFIRDFSFARCFHANTRKGAGESIKPEGFVFFLSFVLARWDGPGEREREERHENIKFSFLCLYLVHSLHMRTDRTCFAGLNGVVSG